MTHFAVYDPATGIIKRTGSCGPRDFALQNRSGEAVIETDGTVRTNTHRVDLSNEKPRAVLATT